jgi:DNA polymerase III subunit delta'
MALRDVIGQDRAVNILLRTNRRGRIPSAYLFAGESGIGKKYTALNLAKALNCMSPSSHLPADGGDSGVADACDVCSSCRKIDSGGHPDVLLISPESGQIRIEEIRAIDDMLSLKAFEGRYRIIITDDADMMNQYAANAFLKTLEEPPQDSLIILVSSNPSRLPDTIKSRCSRINFTPLAHDLCRRVIEKNLYANLAVKGKKTAGSSSLRDGISETPEDDSPRLETLVRFSMGRPGNVVSEDILEERSWFINLLKGMLNAEKDGWASREEMERWFEILLIFIRDMAVLKATCDETKLVNSDLAAYLRKISSSTHIKVIIETYGKLNALKGYLAFNLNKSLTWNYTGSILRNTMDMTHA